MILRRRKVPTPDIRIVVSVNNPLFFAIGVLTFWTTRRVAAKGCRGITLTRAER